MDSTFRYLSGKTALITGSTSFIGKSIAVKLAELGADVIINGRNKEAGKSVIEEINDNGNSAWFEHADLLKEEDVRNMVKRVIDKFKKIDILVASGAGASSDSPSFKLFEEMTAEDFSRYINAHWLTRIYTIHAVFPYMKSAGGGKIIAIGTDAGRVATVGESLIGGATSGMMHMCRVLAREFGRHNVRINNVSMSFVSDSIPRWGQNSEALNPSKKGKKGKGILDGLLKRMIFDVKQNDIAETVAFLSGSCSNAITGQTISVNGGLSTPG